MFKKQVLVGVFFVGCLNLSAADKDHIELTEVEVKKESDRKHKAECVKPVSDVLWTLCATFKEMSCPITHVKFSLDSQAITARYGDRTIKSIKSWCVRTGDSVPGPSLKKFDDEVEAREAALKKKFIMPASHGNIGEITLSQNGKSLGYIYSKGAVVNVHDVYKDSLLPSKFSKRPRNPIDRFGALALDSNGEKIFVSADSIIWVYYIQPSRFLTSWIAHTAVVNSLAVSPDGQMLASGLADGTVKLWRRQLVKKVVADYVKQ